MKTQLSKSARSKARYTDQYETGGIGVVACQWTQCSQGSGRAGDPSAAQARTAIFDYIETFHNRTRLYSSLD
jgi:hypothetical protein